jgi:hypothetical protein
MSILSTLVVLFVVIVLSVIIIKNVIVPAIVNYQHGILNSSEFTIGESLIYGLGIFTKRMRVKGERLFIAINSDKTVTHLGAKINHCPGKDRDGITPAQSILPNTYISKIQDKSTGEWWVIAARNINAYEELTMDYTHTPAFMKKPDPNWRCPI